MLNRFTGFFQQLLRMGIRTDTSFIETQKTYMFNLFLLVAAPFALVSLLINIYWGALIPSVFNILQLSVFGFGFYISYSQKNLHLRTAMLLLLSIIALVAAYYYQNGSEYRLLVMLVAAVVFFDRFWQYLVFAGMLCIAFVFVRINEAMAIEGMTSAETFASIFKIFVPLVLFVMSLFYFKHIYFQNLRALETTNHQLFVAKEEKERILHTVAHDLRSPISNITGLCNIMLSDLEKLSAEQKELIALILQSTDTSLALINNLLQTSETSGPAALFKPVDLGLLLNKSISLLRLNAAEKMIRIETDITVEKISVNADAKRIERVITNLVNNAIKFSPAKSVISIKLFIENGNALLVVADQGIGISKENHEKIFEMFTKARRTGTSGEKSFGMGLSICKQIVEEHGGNIMLESEPLHGSAFIVSLPLQGNSAVHA